ncbi:hypothetical protein L1049_019718 [Liquidambar formosana]|uniref:Homeobox domain-containing protein n=1 Tax=Liquidambar formosana TaxID=63359 RepID=A0AAP0S657_LIQFO
MKSKVLFILLHLCEADSISFLDEVSSSPRSRDLAESVALEVLELLKTAFSRDPRHLSKCSDRTFPMGLLQLSALRLTDIFSDDSNFKSYITIHFTEVVTAIFSFPHGEFLSSWCSSILPVREEDATVEYDAFAAAGWVLDSFSSPDLLNATLNSSSMPQASYAHQRTSLLVKIIANLHCFVPKICKEHEKNLFLHKFLECLQMDLPKSSPGSSFASDSQKAATVCGNLRSLVSHAESLIPNFLSEDDVQLLRVFLNQLQSLTATDEFEVNRLQQIQESKFEGSVSWEKFSKLNIGEHHQEAQSTGGCSSPQLRRVSPNLNNISSNLKEGMSENSAFQEVDQYYVRSNHMDPTDDVMKRDRRKDKDKHGRVTSGGLRETEGDFQNVESSGSDSSSTRGKNSNEQVDNSEFPKSTEHIIESGSGGVHEDEKVENIHCEEKQRRKRKRTIMNDKQMTLIERALLEEPDMQRNAASIQSWADKLSVHGSEVTSSQLKNWLNNRKARLARAAKDVRAMSEGENAFPDKQGGSGGGSFYDSPESPGEDLNVPLTARGTRSTSENSEIALAELADVSPAEFVQCEPGQYVVLENGQGEEIGTGKVYQVQGKWYGRSLEESGTAVVDVIELKVERWVKLPHPSEATGTSFDEAEIKIGAMRVLWDSSKIFMLQSQ